MKWNRSSDNDHNQQISTILVCKLKQQRRHAKRHNMMKPLLFTPPFCEEEFIIVLEM